MTPSPSEQAARRLRPDRPFHLPPGAQPLRSTVELTLSGTDSEPIVYLTDTRRDLTWHAVMERAGDSWHVQLMMPQEMTIVRYHFRLADGSIVRERIQTEMRWSEADEGHRPVFGEWSERDFQIAVYDPARMPADWTQGMVIYQIFPDRFADGDPASNHNAQGTYGHPPLFMQWSDKPEMPPLGRDFFGGDLRGVIDKLDYLTELGVDCLYFTPLFWSPTNHRYDAIDYKTIDPMLGTESDLLELIDKAHARGIRIILDAVFNHCSTDSRYFDYNGRFEEPGARQSKTSRYYRWFDFQDWPDQYTGWLDLGHMPQFVECPEMEDYFVGPEGITAYWLEKGIDGWRTDVTSWKSDEFWRRFRARVDAVKPGAYLVSEEWQDASRYFLGDMYSATMNYRFAWALHGFMALDRLSPTELDDRLHVWMRDTPPPALKAQMNLIGSHDIGRILNLCQGDRQRLRQITAFQLAYPGAPMIYYGDETAIQADSLHSADGRRTMPWDNLDQEMLAYFRRAIGYRKTSRALRLGSVETAVIDDASKAYVFARRFEAETVYAAFTTSDTPVSVTIPLQPGEAGTWSDALGAHAPAEAQKGRLFLNLQPRGAAWYVRG